MKKLTIDQDDFIRAFGRDADFHDKYPQTTYLDLRTGYIRWLYDDDEEAESDLGVPAEENRVLREQVKATPSEYLEILGFSHGGHHAILKEFLASSWTSDEQQREKAHAAYFGSIGGWIKTIQDTELADAVPCYYHFLDLRKRQLAKEFLHKNGIDPGWE